MQWSGVCLIGDSPVCNNGPELNYNAMLFLFRDNNIKLHFIQPGKPTHNAFVESLNGRFREECLFDRKIGRWSRPFRRRRRRRRVTAARVP